MNVFLHRSLLLISILFGFNAFAQQGLEIRGQVVDSLSGDTIPYATVLAVSATSGHTLNGTATEDDGSFFLQTDSTNVFVEIRFIGYNTLRITQLPVNNGKVALGTILLASEAQEIDGVEVSAERSTMEFKLDKRVFHVGKDISSTGVSAMEVLNSVPSVNVDIEGNISLRGNTGVQILIDGKPSVLSDDPSKALGTLTADMIESIEVITNPSAKYEAGGTSGIINIILKKEEKKGFNGSISLNTGYPNNHSIGGSVNYRTQKFNFFTQFGGGYRTMPSISRSKTSNRTNMSSVESDGTSDKNEQFYNITLGADYYLNKYNTITLSGNYAYEIETNPSETDFSVTDSTSSVLSSYTRTEETSATNPKWQYDLQYKKQFRNNKDHMLNFSTLGRFFGKDQESTFKNIYAIGGINSAQRSLTDFYQADYTFQLDYINPLTKQFNLELGSMYEINDVGNDYAVYDQQNSEWTLNTNLTNNFNYNQKVLGVYGTGSYEGQKWGLKLGLRAENTNLQTLLVTTGQANNRNYTNLFPSVHSSFKFNKRFSVQAGYSRRIYRPRLWDLNPFYNIQNNYNIRTGNPDLLPEYGDSYELTSILIFDKWSLNASIYHLYTTDVMETVSYFSDNISISTPMNIGSNRKTGIELNGKYSPLKWFSLTGDFNFGYFNRQGTFGTRSFDFRGEQWSTKITAKFKFPADVDLEITPNYQSGYKTVQGEVSGYLFADAGIRKKLWKGKAVVNLAIRDIFASRIRETTVNQEDYYLYSYSRRGRFITLGFSYSFGKGEAMSYSGGKGM